MFSFICLPVIFSHLSLLGREGHSEAMGVDRWVWVSWVYIMYPSPDFMLYQHSLKFTISLGSFKRRKSGLTGEVYSRHSVSMGLASTVSQPWMACGGQLDWPIVHKTWACVDFGICGKVGVPGTNTLWILSANCIWQRGFMWPTNWACHAMCNREVSTKHLRWKKMAVIQ